jgi:hypothetical protein
MQPDTNRRGRLLYVALGFLGLDVPPVAMPPELRALHAWLDSWHGIGLIAPSGQRIPPSDQRLASLTATRTGSGREALRVSIRHDPI